MTVSGAAGWSGKNQSGKDTRLQMTPYRIQTDKGRVAKND
jgi:hypothetical protein